MKWKSQSCCHPATAACAGHLLSRLIFGNPNFWKSSKNKKPLFKRDLPTERDLGNNKVSHKIKRHNHHLSERALQIWTRSFLTSSDSLSKKPLLLFALCSSPSKSCPNLQKAITTYRRRQECKRIKGKDAFLYLSLHSR